MVQRIFICHILIRQLRKIKKYNRKKNKQDNTCTPFLETLVKQLQKLKGSGSDTDKFVKKIYLDSVKETKKEM